MKGTIKQSAIDYMRGAVNVGDWNNRRDELKSRYDWETWTKVVAPVIDGGLIKEVKKANDWYK